jgi:hypothetical protein
VQKPGGFILFRGLYRIFELSFYNWQLSVIGFSSYLGRNQDIRQYISKSYLLKELILSVVSLNVSKYCQILLTPKNSLSVPSVLSRCSCHLLSLRNLAYLVGLDDLVFGKSFEILFEHPYAANI